MVRAVAVDQLRVVEVVAGVQPDARPAGAARSATSCVGVQQRHLHPVDLAGVGVQIRSANTSVAAAMSSMPQ